MRGLTLTTTTLPRGVPCLPGNSRIAVMARGSGHHVHGFVC